MQLKDNNKIFTFLLLTPWLLTFGIFWLYPLLYAALLSLTKYQTLTGEFRFIGIQNYKKIFTDPVFWTALKNTAVFTFGTVPVTTALSLTLAVILNSKIVKFKSFFRASFFMPTVTSLVVISLIFTNLYGKDGYINMLLGLAGISSPDKGWLLNTSTSLLSIMIMDVWISTGYYMVLFLAGLQTIPQDLYDAARLSGASVFTQFLRITLPLIKPTLLFVVVINTIKSFQIFIEIFIMTKGGPLNSTTTLVYMVFVNAFEKSDMMGYASALAFVLFFILLIFSIVQIKLLRIKQ